MQTLHIKSEERRNFGKIVPQGGGTMTAADQAEGLRQMVRGRTRHARVLAVTSGKGGVGKTNVAVNLALSLASQGFKTVLVDLDLGLANADILLDMNPRFNLTTVLSRQRRIEEVMVRAPGGLYVVPGASGVERLANLSDEERAQLLESFDILYRTADYIVFDTGAGISRNTTGFLAAADDVIVVTIPEPTAVCDAYAVIKMLSLHPAHGSIHLLMNMVSSRQEAERYAGGIAVTASKLLNVYVEKLGYVLSDPKVSLAVRQRSPFLLQYPGTMASRCLRAVAENLVRTVQDAPPDERPGFIRRLFGVLGKRR